MHFIAGILRSVTCQIHMFRAFGISEAKCVMFCTFRGVVLVDVKLSSLDINQCPTLEHGGAFKSTAKCHYDSQYVSIV